MVTLVWSSGIKSKMIHLCSVENTQYHKIDQSVDVISTQIEQAANVDV
jgi:hypothetical protein